MVSVDVMLESELPCPSLAKNIPIFVEDCNDEGSPLSSFLQPPVTAMSFVTFRNKRFSYDEEFLAPTPNPGNLRITTHVGCPLFLISSHICTFGGRLLLP
jgi:hypothetical protein